ncbi:hypothetical protein CHUAL_006489 [Chamberlinius hualienensis]
MNGIALVIAVITASVMAKEDPNCKNDTYYNIPEAIDGVNYCTYSTDNFKPSCVAESCPNLKNQSLCPLESDGSINLTNVVKIFQIVTDCLNSSTICGVAINPIVFPPFDVNTDDILQGTTLTGSCGPTGNDNFIYNVSKHRC